MRTTALSRQPTWLNSIDPATWVRAGWLLAVFLTALIWLAYFLWQPPSSQWRSSPETATPGQNQPLASTPAQFDIFGQANTNQTASNAPVSRLELRLTGTMAGDDPASGLAFIDNKQGQQKSFRPGEMVFDLAELVAIYPDYVLLRHNGREEKIPLTTGGQFRAKPQTRTSTTKRASLPGIRQDNQQTGRSAQAQADAIRQKYLIRPEDIASKIQVVPFTDGGQLRSGLRVSALRQGDLLQRAGLKSNDLITAINGQAISPTNMMNLAAQLEKSSQVSLTIRRDGRNQTMQLDLNALRQK